MNHVAGVPAQDCSGALAMANPTALEPAQYLTFLLGRETFGIGIAAIKEIIVYGPPTAVPMMPPSVCGVINLRGSVVPVVDLNARFGGHATEVGKRTSIVIVEVTANAERQVIGVVVEGVDSVSRIAAADIEPPPAFGTHARAEFIQGMGKVHGRLVILLDLDRTLCSGQLESLRRPLHLDQPDSSRD